MNGDSILLRSAAYLIYLFWNYDIYEISIDYEPLTTALGRLTNNKGIKRLTFMKNAIKKKSFLKDKIFKSKYRQRHLLGECSIHYVDGYSVWQCQYGEIPDCSLPHHPVDNAMVRWIYRVLEYRHHCIGQIVY